MMRLVRTLFAHAAESWLGRFAALTIACLINISSGNAAVIEATTLPPAPTPPPTGAKFLFIVETSAAMNRFEHSGRQVVFDLIYTGVSNQMQKADSYGVWTFGEAVNAGAYPMQIWSGEKSLEQASKVGVFLKGERYKGKPHLELAVGKALSLVKSIKDVNVIIVTSGDASLGLSELEVKLRDVYQRKSEQARQKRVPVVLSFSSTEGEIAVAAVSLPGEQINLREDLLAKAREPLKKSLMPTNEVAKVIAPASTNSVRPKPIIMIGQSKSHAPAPASVPTPPVDVALVETMNTSETASSASNVPALIQLEKETNAALPTASSPTPMSKALLLAQTPKSPQIPAPAITVKTPETPTANLGKPIKPTEAVQTPFSAEVVRKEVGSEPTEPVGLNKILAAPMKVAAREPEVSPGAASPSPVVATTVPINSASGAGWVMILGASFFAAALALSAWVLYRLRTARQASFISQSMNRK